MRSLPAIASLLLAVACSTFSTSSGGRVGTNGWVEKRNKLNEYIQVERPGGEVEIRAHDAGRFLIRTHRPQGDVTVPVYPGAALEDTQERPIWVNRIYRIPDNGDFARVYNWYMDWFAFAAPVKN